MSASRVLCVVGAALGILAVSSASGSVVAGGLMPIAVNTNGTGLDGFALVALSPIGAGEVVYISDNELTTPTSTTFNTGESYSKWTSPAGGVAAGTVLIFNAFDTAASSFTGTVNFGTVAPVTFAGSANRGLSTGAESLYFYQAASDALADTPLNYVSFIYIGGVPVPATDGQIPAALSASYAISLTGGQDSAQYTGPRSGQAAFGDYVPLIDDLVTNWTLTALGTDPSTFNATAFTITPAPAGSIALVALGGVLVGRRRRV